MTVVEIYNQTNFRVNKKKLTVLTKFVLKKLSKKFGISVILVDIKEMKRVNKLYRGIDKATDGLSFCYNDEKYGEIIMCPEYIKAEAKKLKIFQSSLYETVLIHSLLHICGHDHVKQAQAELMEKLEKKLHNSFNQTK